MVTQLMSQCAIYESIKDSQIPAYTQANWKLYFYLLQNYCMFREYSDFQVTQVISMFRTLLSIVISPQCQIVAHSNVVQ